MKLTLLKFLLTKIADSFLLPFHDRNIRQNPHLACGKVGARVPGVKAGI